MVLFNLLPSFPMDGGRILRATLAFFMPHKLATTIAASVGVAFAIVFIAYALLGQNINYGLVFLGVFVLLAANSEGNLLGQIKRKLGLYNINEFIRQDTFVLYENEPLETVIDYFKQSSKKTSLVYNGLHQIVGIFDLNSCIQNANSISEFSLVKDIMIRHWPLINFHDTVKSTLLKLNEYNLDYVPVYYKNNYIGTLNKNDIV